MSDEEMGEAMKCWIKERLATYFSDDGIERKDLLLVRRNV